MGDAKKPGWGAFLPRFNIPETFGTALSYEGQLHWFLENWDQVAEYANDLEQPTIDVGATTFPDTGNALKPSIVNVGTDINAVLDFSCPVIRTRFADPLQWDFDTAYDVLTVVSDGQGNSYTSRQAVPSHTPLTDTDYWVLTGVYDASLQAIRDDVASVKSGYARVYSTVADMQSDTELLSGMICHTLGFHSIGDGGAAWYIIGAGDPNGMDVLQLATNDCASMTASAYVTPEMYGAFGNGIDDDSACWQAAVDSGLNVVASSTVYLCGNITVTKNITVDCASARFVCNADNLFVLTGHVTGSVSAPDYTAYKSDYIAGDYSGFAMMRGTNNFEPARSYYRGGFVCMFDNGALRGSYPINVTGVTVDMVNPITATVENIGDIKHTVQITKDTRSIEVIYGVNCVVNNINELSGSSYIAINFDKCMGCVAKNLSISHSLLSTDNNSYIVAFSNSSFCRVRDSELYNEYWHCVTSGDTYLCYCNEVASCTLSTSRQYVLLDHENALGTNVHDCVINGSVSICGMSKVINCILTSRKASSSTSPVLRIVPSGTEGNGTYDICGVKFLNDSSTGRGGGVWVMADPQVTGNTYYIDKISIDNIHPAGLHPMSMELSVPSTSNFVIKDIYVNNSWINIYAGVATQTNIDISNYRLNVSGLNERFLGSLAIVGNAGYTFGDLNISNSSLYSIGGHFSNVYFDKLRCAANISDLDVTGQLFGSLLESWATQKVLDTPAEVMIDEIRGTVNSKWINIINENDRKYYQTLENGQYVTHLITSA